MTPERRAELRTFAGKLLAMHAAGADALLECLYEIDALLQAAERRDRLAADTDPAPPDAEETPTRPSTPEARRRSSGTLAAVRGPVEGLAQRVADELAKGREPS